LNTRKSRSLRPSYHIGFAARIYVTSPRNPTRCFLDSRTANPPVLLRRQAHGRSRPVEAVGRPRAPSPHTDPRDVLCREPPSAKDCATKRRALPITGGSKNASFPRWQLRRSPASWCAIFCRRRFRQHVRGCGDGARAYDRLDRGGGIARAPAPQQHGGSRRESRSTGSVAVDVTYSSRQSLTGTGAHCVLRVTDMMSPLFVSGAARSAERRTTQPGCKTPACLATSVALRNWVVLRKLGMHPASHAPGGLPFEPQPTALARRH